MKSHHKNVATSGSIKGQRVREYDDTHFYFELLANEHTYKTFLKDVEQQRAMYKIRFHDTRTTFLSQHLALEYIKKHNLVGCLINHEFYEKNMPEKPVDIQNYPFR